MYAEIIVDIFNNQVDRIFTYKANEDTKLGHRVLVPFGRGNKPIEGFVIGFIDEPSFDPSKIKEVIRIIDDIPVFDEDMIKVAKFVSNEYRCPLVGALTLIMPSGIKGRDNLLQYEKWFKVTNIVEAHRFIEESKGSLKLEKQFLLMSYMIEKKEDSIRNIKNVLYITDSPIKSLLKKGLIEETQKEKNLDPFKNVKYDEYKKINLNEEQRYIYEDIKRKMLDGLSKNLIHGVTASGKTEIYMHLIEDVIAEGKSAIFLVPEISLTPQMVERFKGRFGDKVAVTHSRLNNSEKYDQWKKAKDGQISIMIGPRSALYTPFNNLGIIVIDEEHEKTYKSETTPKYDAIEVAEKICEIKNAALILGSATPSIRAYKKAKDGIYNLYTMKNRVLNYKMPKIEIADMREELMSGNRSIFSLKLKSAIEESLNKNEKIILFLNRRGFSNFVSCRECGYVMKCNNCDISYTHHGNSNKVSCHYCGKEEDYPKVCPECGSKYIKSFGVGTERVYDEFIKNFKGVKALRMDSDTIKNKHSYKEIIDKFKSDEYSALVGTQMITVGHDFKNVGLIAVVAADMLINFDDFKTGENAYQLISQVIGRAGRNEGEAKAIIQTYEPDNYVLKNVLESSYEDFYNEEIMYRSFMNYPPFIELGVITIKGEDQKQLVKDAMTIKKFIKDNKFENINIIGPTKAKIYKLRNIYRYKILVKSKSKENIIEFYEKLKIESILDLDFNPINML
ncbi:MAG: primosomal protein N' [Clostridia bacterium]|nr:primosomal protein N' [Clostridia bacterium]